MNQIIKSIQMIAKITFGIFFFLGLHVSAADLETKLSVKVSHDRVGQTIQVVLTNYSSKRVSCKNLILKSVFIDSKVMLDEKTEYTALNDFSVDSDKSMEGNFSYSNNGVLQFTDVMNIDSCR